MDSWARGWDRDQEKLTYHASTETSICCGHPQTTQAEDAPIEKTPTGTGQGDGENDIVLVKLPQRAGLKYTVFQRRKNTKKRKKRINPRKLEAVVKKLSQAPEILERCFFITVYCLLKNYILISSYIT